MEQCRYCLWSLELEFCALRSTWPKGPGPMSRNGTQSPQINYKLLILNELPEICPLLGEPANNAPEFWCSWKPLGTLWKDFSPLFPFLDLRTVSHLAGNSFVIYKIFIFSRLIKNQFKNFSLCLRTLWKPDCDCQVESLKAAMGF